MKIHYFIEYTSAKNNHRYKVDCGNSIRIVESVVYRHLKEGDFNLTIAPQLEDNDNKEDDINIVEVNP